MSTLSNRLSSSRAQHLVFLAHVWACAPFLVLWMLDLHDRQLLGPEAVTALRGVIMVTLGYLVVRTWVAWKDPDRAPWYYVFTPVDVVLITLILYLSHRGPSNNVTLLYFLPMIQASGSLNVRWAAAVGVMVVVGTVVASFGAVDVANEHVARTVHDLIRTEPLNAAFRIYFLIVLSSLMAYQALIAAGLKERLAVAADRNRIAMDMHDGVQGHLITLAAQLELIERVAPGDGRRAAEIAEDGRLSVRQATDELRFLVQRLRSPGLAAGFVAAMRQFAHNVCERHGLTLDFQVDGSEVVLDPDVEEALFRIAQEALTNVVKHAGAGGVRVKLEYVSGAICLTVADDGRGLEASGICGGLAGIRERAAKVGGSATITSIAGEGVTVAATVPVISR